MTNKQIPNITAVILAGGQSSRMGSNKALLPYRGGRFIEAIHRQLAELFEEVILVTNRPEQYAFLTCAKVPDLFPGMGALAGLHSGLHHAANQFIFAVACDMPYLNSTLIRRLSAHRHLADVVIARGEKGWEPLHAVYSKSCLNPMQKALSADRKRIVSFFPEVQVCEFSSDSVADIDPGFDSFRNINTPEEYYRLRAEFAGSTSGRVDPAEEVVKRILA